MVRDRGALIVATTIRRRVFLLVILLVCCVPTVAVSLTWLACSIIGGGKRAWRIAIGYDLLANVTLGGNVGETISSRAGRHLARGDRWACVLCRFLDVFQKNHCQHEIQSQFVGR